jgi:hypothetical protein
MHVLDNGSEEYEGYLYNVERSIEGDAAEQWYAGESIFREGNAVLYEEIGRFGDPLGTFGDMEFGGNAFTYSGGQLSLYGESDYGPYFGVVRRIGSGYDQVAHAVRMGNLKDFLDITNEHYGIGIGDTSHFMRYTPEDGLLFRTALGGTQIDDDGVTTNSLNILESPVPEEFVEGQATLYVAGDEIIVHYNDKETVLNKLNGMAPIMHDDISSDRVIQVTLNGTVSLTATDMASVRIPTALSGMYLVEVAAHCGKDNTTGQSTSGAVQISVQNGTQNMLSSNLYIDAGQYDSSNSASPAAIDTDHDDIAAGNVINVEVVSAGVGVTYLTVTLVFRSPVV